MCVWAQGDDYDFMQIVCLAEEIRFTRDIEQILARGEAKIALDDFRRSLASQLAQFTGVAVEDTLMSLRLKALILDIIHHISIVDALRVADDR